MGNIDSFERRCAVIKSVVQTFREKRKKLDKEGIDIAYFNDKHYILWIETQGELAQDVYDDLTRRNPINQTLEQAIMEGLYNEEGIEINSLEIKRGNLDGKKEQEAVADVILFIEETSITTPTPTQDTVRKARITLVPRSPGSLVKPRGYKIDSKHTPYNIGRVVKSDNSNRINHIEIIDETVHVSRAHAHIDFNDKDGFFIQKEENIKGTNSTIIMRKGEKDFELRNSEAKRNLKDGDIIKLSNWVLLEFHIITK